MILFLNLRYHSLVLSNFLTSFLQRLIFLIRDWGSPYEYPYGQDGGESYVQQILKVRFEFIRNQKHCLPISNRNFAFKIIKLDINLIILLVFYSWKVKEDDVEELQNIRRKLEKWFSNIGGFLLPHPGKIVVTKKEYDGLVKGNLCHFCD